MNQTKLSIIVPCYRVEDCLEQCVSSIVNPYMPEVEIILVDDGSPDKVPEMCDEWRKRDARIRVIHQKNQGLSVARNTGYDASDGAYVWFIDSDDWLVEGMVKYVLELIEDHPEMDIFTTPLIWDYGDQKKNRVDIRIETPCVVSGKEFVTHFPTGTIQRNIIKKRVLTAGDIRFYPGILHEDAVYGPELYYMAKSIYVMSEPIYHYRQRNNSMHSLGIRSAYDMITAHKQLMLFCEEYVASGDRRWFRTKYLTCFKAAIDFVWHCRKSSEFRRYLEDTRDYRINECLACVKGASLFNKLQIYLLAYSPVFCVFCSKIVKTLLNLL